MFLNNFVIGLGAIAAIVAGSPAGPVLDQRQERFTIQNWKNDFASVNFTSGPAGQFDVTWNNRPGGNFVVGKGYRPARDM